MFYKEGNGTFTGNAEGLFVPLFPRLQGFLADGGFPRKGYARCIGSNNNLYKNDIIRHTYKGKKLSWNGRVRTL